MEMKEILAASTALGFDILSHGAETYRVEESITRMCAAYGYQNTDVFVIPSSIVVTITDDTGAYLTRTRRILSRDTDLDKVDKLNALCRQICEQTPEYGEIMARLQEIEQGPVYSMPMQYFGFGTISAFFTLFYGGVLVDAAAAFVLGVLLKVVIHQLEKLEASSFFVNIVGGAFTACGCYLAVKAGFALSQDKMIIGMLMNLVPGIALTNAMREFIAADLISGMIKFAEAVVTAIGIAIGVVVSLAIFTPFLEVLLV